MKPVIKIGIAIVVVAIFGVTANQLGGDDTEVIPIVSEVDIVDTDTVEKVDVAPVIDENLSVLESSIFLVFWPFCFPVVRFCIF